MADNLKMVFPKINKRIQTANKTIISRYWWILSWLAMATELESLMLSQDMRDHIIVSQVCTVHTIHSLPISRWIRATVTLSVLVHKLHEITMNSRIHNNNMGNFVVQNHLSFIMYKVTIFIAYKLYNPHFDGHIRIICYTTRIAIGAGGHFPKWATNESKCDMIIVIFRHSFRWI